MVPGTSGTYSSRVIYTNGSHDSTDHSASSPLFAKLISDFSFDNTFPPVVFILGSICLVTFKKEGK